VTLASRGAKGSRDPFYRGSYTSHNNRQHISHEQRQYDEVEESTNFADRGHSYDGGHMMHFRADASRQERVQQVRAGVKEMNLHGQTDGAQDRSPPVAIPGGPHKTRIAMPKNVMANVPAVPFILFQRTQSGAGWLTDLLAKQDNIWSFVPKAQKCADSPDALAAWMHEALQNPPCQRADKNATNECTAAIDTKCSLKSVHGAYGFAVDAFQKPCLDWDQYSKMITNTSVPTRIVRYVRSNTVKQVIGKYRKQEIKERCSESKTSSTTCEKEVQQARMTIDPQKFLKDLKSTVSYYHELQKEIKTLTVASGHYQIFTLSYESLQIDPEGALMQLFNFLGIQNPITQVRGEGLLPFLKKENLKDVVGNYDEVTYALRDYPCFSAQFAATTPREFKLCDDDAAYGSFKKASFSQCGSSNFVSGPKSKSKEEKKSKSSHSHSKSHSKSKSSSG